MDMFRSAGSWGPRTFFRSHDDNISIDRSIVPDYVVNFMRGETPETLAMKKERTQWGQKDVIITPRRDTLMSYPIEFDHYYSSSTDLTGGMNGNSYDSLRSNPRKNYTGWRGGVVLNTLISFLILVVGVICLIVGVTKTNLLSGESTIFSGDCAKADNINMGVHVVINVLVVVLLAAANYVFQVLSSPTRQEVSTAHAKKRWLDIGVPSIRNFAHISSFRASLATFVLLAAVATQVICNAVIFTSQITDESGIPQTCSVHLSGSLLGIVALLNLAMVIGMAVILARSTFEPLATLGDAVRYFLHHPDPTTEGACLLTKSDVRQGRWGSSEPRQFVPSNHYLLQAPSIPRWALAVFAWLALSVPTAAALSLIISANPEPEMLTPFGGASPSSTYRTAQSLATIEAALLAALPQLLVAVLYLTTNALLTTYFLSHEFSLFALGPRPLRVSSNPTGLQTTSLYLTLPRPVSWVLLFVFAALGFVLSQAVFPLLSSSVSSSDAPAIAFSTTALLALLTLLVILAISVVGVGLKRASAAVFDVDDRPRGNPLTLNSGSCSAVLSAKCHATRSERELWLGPVAFGVVREGLGGAGRCAFSGRPVGAVHVAGTYA